MNQASKPNSHEEAASPLRPQFRGLGFGVLHIPPKPNARARASSAHRHNLAGSYRIKIFQIFFTVRGNQAVSAGNTDTALNFGDD